MGVRIIDLKSGIKIIGDLKVIVLSKRPLIFLAFLIMVVMWLSKVKFGSIFTPKSRSRFVRFFQSSNSVIVFYIIGMFRVIRAKM